MVKDLGPAVEDLRIAHFLLSIVCFVAQSPVLMAPWLHTSFELDQGRDAHIHLPSPVC